MHPLPKRKLNLGNHKKRQILKTTKIRAAVFGGKTRNP